MAMVTVTSLLAEEVRQFDSQRRRRRRRKQRLREERTGTTYQLSADIVVTPRGRDLGFTPEQLAEMRVRDETRLRELRAIRQHADNIHATSTVIRGMRRYVCGHCGAVLFVRATATKAEDQRAYAFAPFPCCAEAKADRHDLQLPFKRADRQRAKRRRNRRVH